MTVARTWTARRGCHQRSGRPPYSFEFEAVLAQGVGLDGSGRLLDARCGPGVLTVRLAPLFEEAVGLDADILAEAVERLRRGASAISAGRRLSTAPRWQRTCPGRRQDHTDWSPPGSPSAGPTSRGWPNVYDMLGPRWALALIVHTVAGRPRPPCRWPSVDVADEPR